MGYFIRPTILEIDDPADEAFSTEYFGPILAVHVYADRKYDKVLDQMESAAPYALTGSIIATDRAVIADAEERLRFAAGNFYINDKPTGAVVGQQPFGGGRASGTNDKAGSAQNLLRWTSALDQGDVRAGEDARLPAHGLTPDGIPARAITFCSARCPSFLWIRAGSILTSSPASPDRSRPRP